MKLRAVRLAEVATFSEGIAIEGFSGGLDLLARDNEFGKSTIKAAIEAVFAFKCSAQRDETKALRPYAGGRPTIEVDFDIDATPWRIRKSYLSRPSAELENRTSGQRLSGEDAENKLRELLSGQGRVLPLPMLWVEQGDSLTPWRADPNQKITLRDLLAAETTAAIDETSARVGAAVAHALDELLTARSGAPKKNGAYKYALTAYRTASSERQTADTALAKQRTNLDTLATLKRERDALSDPAAAHERARAVADAERALADAEAKIRDHTAAKAEAEKAAIAFNAAHAAHQTFAKLLTERARLDAERTRIQSERTSLSDQLGTASRSEAEVRTARDAALQAYTRTTDRLAVARAQAAARLRDDLAARRATLARIVTEIMRLDVAIAANPATPDVMARLAGADQAAVVAKARLDAAAPSVAIKLDPAGAGRIKIAGAPITADTKFNPTEPLVLDIAGVGRITIAPGGADSLAAAQSAADTAARTRSDLLAKLGVADLAAAHALAAARARLVDDKRTHEIELKTLGSDRELQAKFDEADRLAASVPAASAEPPLSTDAAEAARDTAAQALASAEKRHGEATRDLDRHQSALDTVNMTLARINADIARATTELSAADSDPAAHLAKLGEALAAAKTENESAQVALQALTRTLPDTQARTRLAADLDTARSRASAATSRIAQLATEISFIDGELTAARNAGIAGDAEAAHEREHAARADLDRVETRVAALKLLKSRLDAAEAGMRDTLTAPALNRMEPYLAQVLPGAALALDADCATTDLMRDGRREAIDRLSGGTREQLAIITRLGLARLFADRGTPRPVLLDDALVFADDARIAQMFRTLEAASVHHQVIVLTCHTHAFANLRATRLDITPWQPAMS
jgi:hypothetical protein